MYETLNPRIRAYVDALLDHAQSCLWPERRAALESFRRGMARCARSEQEATAFSLGFARDEIGDPVAAVFRVVLTAYLGRLGEAEITNPDQATLYSQSFDRVHAKLAEQWFAAHPDRRQSGN